MAETNQVNRKKRRRKRKPGDPIPMPGWLFYPLLLGTMSGAGLLYLRGDIIAAFAVILVAGSAGTGFRMGLGRIVASILGLIAAIHYAPALGMKYADQFSSQFGTTGLMNRFLCIAAIGVLISLVVTILATMINNRFMAKRRAMNWFNGFAGFAFGMVEGVAVVWLVLGGLLSLQLWQRDENIQGNQVADAIDEWASRTRQSVIGPIVRDYNPFERIELLAGARQWNKTIRRLGDPNTIEQLMDDPRIDELRVDPSIASAIDEIRQDRQLNELIDQRRSLDMQTVMHLMSSPTVMRLADDPKFTETVREVIHDLN